MDAHLFVDRVPEGSLPDDGPWNRRRPFVYLQSLWLNEDHDRFPPCRFEDYLSLRGWNRELIIRGQWQRAHPDNIHKRDDECIFDTIAVIQAWMTLGFLEDLYQNRQWAQSYLRPLPEKMVPIMMQMPQGRNVWERLCRRPAGKVLIFNTKRLGSNLAAMTLLAHDGHFGAERLARLPILLGHFARAFNQLSKINRYDERRDVTRNPIDPDGECAYFFFLIMSFPKLIFEAARFHLPAFAPDIDLDLMTNVEQKYVRDLQEENGWCPHRIERLSQTTKYSVVHWLWASDFSDLGKGDHSGCSQSKCHALRVASEAEYPEAHAKGCDGNCARYHVQTDHVLQALSQNRVPLISAKPYTNEESRYALSVTSFDPKARGSPPQYVAFSHVWSDGLGSTPEQGIPSCQAQFLAEVSFGEGIKFDRSTAFWIDSLCVPRDAIARKKAIELMSCTYQLARTVLVLDDTIRKVTLNDEHGRLNSREYFLLRIYMSPWNNRLWTYQEAGLAQRLVFLLAEEQKIILDIPLDVEGPQRGNLSLTSIQALLRHVYTFLYAEVRALNRQENVVNIGTVALQLRWRDTLHRDPQGRNDEILAVSTLLGLDMARLLNEPEGSMRMALFYKLVGRLYSNIVFMDVPRLQMDGFRWAPATFLVRDERRPHTNLEVQGVDCTEHGLLGTYVTFSVADKQVNHYDGTQRITLVHDQKSFDLVAFSQVAPSHNFWFTHIIIYPAELPAPSKDIRFVAAAVLEDKNFVNTQQDEQDAHFPDFVGVFQAVVHLCWLRDWDTPVDLSSFPNGELVILCDVAKQTLLLR